MSELLTAYYVCFSEKKTVFDSFGERKVSYWTSELLSKRLLSLKYYISKAELVILDNVTKHLVEDVEVPNSSN